MNMHKNAWLTPRGRERIVWQVDGWDRFSLTTRRVTYSWKIGTLPGNVWLNSVSFHGHGCASVRPSS